MKTIKKDECSYSVSNAIRTLAMVCLKGFEPPTYWFVASYSIQLSYRHIYILNICKYITLRRICQAFF